MKKELIMTRRELLAAATALTVISCIPKVLHKANRFRRFATRRGYFAV